MAKVTEEEMVHNAASALRAAGVDVPTQAARTLEHVLQRADPLDLVILRRQLQNREDTSHDDRALMEIQSALDALGRYWARHRA